MWRPPLLSLVNKFCTSTYLKFPREGLNFAHFYTGFTRISKAQKFCITKMYSTDDLMCGDNGDVLEDTFGDEIDNFQPLPDGEYLIKSNKFTHLALDLSENVDGGIIHCHGYNSGDNQTWLLTYDADKEGYTIKNKQNPNILLSWNENACRENILRGYTKNDSKNHCWRIESTEDGYFKFRSLENLHMIITIQDIFSSFGGKQVVMDKEINSDKETSQKWIINPVYFRTLPDGDYNIFNCNISDMVVGLSNEEDSSVHPQNYSIIESQEWKFCYDSNKEAYKIKSALNTTLLLSSYGDASTEEMLLRACIDDGEASQYWRIERINDGSFRLRNMEQLHFILTLNATTSKNSKCGLKLQVCNDSDNENANICSKWIIKSVCYQSIPDGNYHIFNNDLPDTVIDFHNQEDALVYGNSYIANDSQTWKFVYNKDRRAYQINSSLRTDLLLCWDSNATDKMFLQAYTESRHKNECWRIEKINNGTCRLRNLEDTEKLLTVIDKASAYGGKELKMTDIKESRNTKTTVSSNWILQNIDKPSIPNGKFKIATKSNYKRVINSNEESNLMISDNLNLVSSEWKILYEPSKRAYKIYSSKDEHLGWVYQNNNCIIDKVDGTDLKNYWLIECRTQAGGYLIRSLLKPSQAVTYSDENNIVTDKALCTDNQLFNFIRH